MVTELAATYFFLQERRAAVVDIREAWPILDIDATVKLCLEVGVPHPYRGVYPEPFTIDFVITERVGDTLVYRAVAVTAEDDAAEPDRRRRLSVVYRWCKSRNIAWTLADTSKFTREMPSTLRTLRGWFRARFEPDEDRARTFAEMFMSMYERNVPLNEMLDRLASRMRIKREGADDYFLYCGWVDTIKVALDRELTFDAPLILRGN